MTALYNEVDPFAAEWLRHLIARGAIAPGVVDTRSIEDIAPAELAEFTQVHFFAGIGVWSYALRRAGWRDNWPIWTGSCPCQPFSSAGKGGGFDDERHLWPAFHWLIEQCGPAVVVGEQVASKDGLAWLDLVSADMEASHYAFGAVDTCAAGFGAPHIRQRLYWSGVAGLLAAGRSGAIGQLGNTHNARLEGLGRGHQAALGWNGTPRPAATTGELGGMGNAGGGHTGAERQQRGGKQRQQPEDGSAVGLANANGTGAQRQPGDASEAARLPQSQCEPEHDADVSERSGADRDGRNDMRSDGLSGGAGRPSPTNGLWADADWLHCRDGKWRPVEPGTFPLAHGATGRVGSLRGYGNAINAAQAQAFIEALMDTLGISA